MAKTSAQYVMGVLRDLVCDISFCVHKLVKGCALRLLCWWRIKRNSEHDANEMPGIKCARIANLDYVSGAVVVLSA